MRAKLFSLLIVVSCAIGITSVALVAMISPASGLVLIGPGDNGAPQIAVDESGFLQLESANVPPMVRSGADSIFRIVIPMEAMKRTLGISVFRGDWIIRSLRKRTPDFRTTATILQIENCQRHQRFWGLFDFVRDRECVISAGYADGTAFLAKNGRTLYTARHLMKYEIGFQTVMRKWPPDDWPFFLFDRNGVLVYDATRDPVRPVRDLTPENDVFAIELSRDIGQPLKIKSTSLNLGERVFAVGFPTCTGCSENTALTTPEMHKDFSDRSPRPNADGKSLRVSLGRVVDEEYFNEVYGQDASSFDSQRFIFTNADCVRGNSGGPDLSADGEVIGVQSHSSFQKFLGETQRLCAFAKMH